MAATDFIPNEFEVEVGIFVVGVQFNRLLVRLQSFVQLALPVLGIAKVVEGLRPLFRGSLLGE